MTLTLNKLSKILKNNGLIPKKYFLLDKYCIYIEVFSMLNADNFLVYIPSKYDLKYENEGEYYDLKEVNVPENGEIPVEYAGEVDDNKLEDTYDNVDLDLSINKSDTGSLEDKLNESYDVPISLKDITLNDTNRIREIFRQLKRLKLCVQNIKYKICILYKSYMCCIRRDNTFDAFLAKELNGGEDMKLMITIDMESLIKSLSCVAHDVKTVRESIYKVLVKNQTKHIKVLEKMLDYKNTLSNNFINIKTKQKRYNGYIKSLEEMFSVVEKQENSLLLQIEQANEKYSESSSLNQDIERSHVVGKINDELKQLSVVKQEIMKNLVVIKSKLENLSLRVDEICFDNIVMIDAITRNFEIFSKF
tara:strand:- start:3591 stop:4676 length:1086 start_codon:yes stop_codon:yes gene_type:complete